MKNLTLSLLVLLFAMPAMAGNDYLVIFDKQDACALYSVMKTEAVAVPDDVPNFGVTTKELSGLECRFTESNEGGTYDYGCECIFQEDLTLLERGSIYNGIDVDENCTGLEDALCSKAVGKLVFTMASERNGDVVTRDYRFSVFGE